MRTITKLARRPSASTLVLLPLLFSAIQGCKKSDNGGGGGSTGAIPSLSLSPVSKDEGNSGTTAFAFEITLGNAYGKDVSVTFSTADGTAVAGEDYQAVNKQTVTIPAGKTAGTFTVNVTGDEWKEGTEDFFVNLESPVNCTLSGTTYKGFINNDDTRILIGDTGGNTSPTTYAGYTLDWSDEFGAATLDAAKWAFDNGDGCPSLCGWGNNELEWYTPGDNLYLQDGKLIMEARAESKGTRNYTSTRMKTQDRKAFGLGRIDIRAKVPKGKGIWPAFWMLGTSIATVGWPKCGEIDIMELLGHEPAKVHSTVHYGNGPGSIQITRSRTSSEAYSEGFHLYSLIREQDRMRFFVDNQPIMEVVKADLGGNNYPFNDPFFLIMNTAVGGNWPGNPDATTRFPQWLIVDYVRYFK